MTALTASGVFSASPSAGEPGKPGKPKPSKSLRTQSAVVSVSVPLGMRDAPPAPNGLPSKNAAKHGRRVGDVGPAAVGGRHVVDDPRPRRRVERAVVVGVEVVAYRSR